MNPKIIAQKTPQTTTKTIPTTKITGSDNFDFGFVVEAGFADAGAFGAAGAGAAVPLNEKVFPSLKGRAGVLVSASSALPGAGAKLGGCVGTAVAA